MSSFGYYYVILVLTTLLEGATARNYIVGDGYGWGVPNTTDYYTDVWAKNKTFLIRDRLLFIVNNSLAIIPTKQQYEHCDTRNATESYRMDERGNLTIDIPLTENGTRYFSSLEHDECIRGQKMEITVGNGKTLYTWAAPLPLFILYILVISVLNSHA